MDIVLTQFTNFMNALDWFYIFSFILITYVIQYYQIPQFIGRGLELQLKNRYQVLLIGVVYAILVFFMRDYDVKGIGTLIISFFFATVFHKFLLEVLLERIVPKPGKVDQEDLL